MPLDITNAVDLIARHGFAEPRSDFGLAKSQTTFPVEELALCAHPLDPEGEPMADAVSVAQNHKAIVRTDTNQTIGVVSQRYNPLNNRDFYQTIEQAVRETVPEDMREGVQVRERMSGHGAWSQREYVFPRYSEELKNTEHATRVGLRIIAWNSYDGSASAGLMTGLIDFYCTNGMIVGSQVSRELRRHSTRLTPDVFIPRLRANLEGINDSIAEIQKMMETPLDNDQMLTFLEKNLSGQRAAEMVKRVEVEKRDRGDNLFALHSALTNYASHDSEDFATRGSDEQRTARMLRGREDEVFKLVNSREFREMVEA